MTFRFHGIFPLVVHGGQGKSGSVWCGLTPLSSLSASACSCLTTLQVPSPPTTTFFLLSPFHTMSAKWRKSLGKKTHRGGKAFSWNERAGKSCVYGTDINLHVVPKQSSNIQLPLLRRNPADGRQPPPSKRVSTCAVFTPTTRRGLLEF